MSQSPDPRDEISLPSGEDLDHTPLTFGKYKGVTPSELATVDPQYIRWMYEEVKNKPTCSKVLYDDCAGKKAPAVKSWKKPEAATSPKIKDHFDSYGDEDEIPF